MRKNIIDQIPDTMKNISTNDMKSTIINALNNSDIGEDIKEQINNGDTEGLKVELINKLNSGDENNQRMANMLKNNDMDGLKNQLMGMFMGANDSEKKK